MNISPKKVYKMTNKHMNILSYQGNANQNYNKLSLHTLWDGWMDG